MRTLFIASLALAAGPAGAAEHVLTAYANAEPNGHPDKRGHGVLLLAYDALDVSRTTDLAVELNTDTVRLQATEIPLKGETTLNLRLTGEYRIAGLSTDYWQEGEDRPERTFESSYVQGQLWVKGRPAGSLWMDAELGLRRWFFDQNGEKTGPDFRLPPEVWSFEPRVRATWWALDDDAAWHARHRLFPRLRGWAVGLEAGLDLRSDTHAWGDPDDDRNRPTAGIARLRPWALAGWQFAEVARWQGTAEGALSAGDDDLGRRRVGGLEPYVAGIPGVFWGHHLSDRYGHVSTSLPFKVWREVEAGPMAALAVVNDRGRTGDLDTYDPEWGLGAAVEARIGGWQADLRGGYSPSLSARADRAAWNALAGVGWAGWF